MPLDILGNQDYQLHQFFVIIYTYANPKQISTVSYPLARTQQNVCAPRYPCMTRAPKGTGFDTLPEGALDRTSRLESGYRIARVILTD
jgi:hypothetical protein